MRNPKKASNRYEIESRACYLTNRRPKKRRDATRGEPPEDLGLGLSDWQGLVAKTLAKLWCGTGAGKGGAGETRARRCYDCEARRRSQVGRGCSGRQRHTAACGTRRQQRRCVEAAAVARGSAALWRCGAGCDGERWSTGADAAKSAAQERRLRAG